MDQVRLFLYKCYIFAELGEEKLTVGKIYAGLLIAENWKAFKTAAKSKGMVR